MPTEKPIINFAVDEDFLRRIDDFRFDNRINTRSEAIRRLIEEGLKVANSPTPKPKKN
jgi:metal-responsive CopG/Arc/MetJ family transcriptional regulator